MMWLRKVRWNPIFQCETTETVLFTKSFILVVIGILATSCNHSNKISSLRDHRDNKTYQCKQFGEQTWMIENLAYETSSGKSTFYAGDSVKYHQYGRMYFPEDIKEAGRIPGWHVPDKAEWSTLLAHYHLPANMLHDDDLMLKHEEDLHKFLQDFNFKFGGLWHQQFQSPNKYQRCFEYRNQAGYYWSANYNYGGHVGIGLYKTYWLENCALKPFMAQRSGDQFRFCIRLIKDE